MKRTLLHPLHRQRVTFPRWGWWLIVVVVAVIGCLPTVIVRFQIQATLDEFDANRVRAGRLVKTQFATAAHRRGEGQGAAAERETGVVR